MVLLVKNLTAKERKQMKVRSLGWEDFLEEGMTTHFQYSNLENPMDRGVWSDTVHRVAKLDTSEVT